MNKVVQAVNAILLNDKINNFFHVRNFEDFIYTYTLLGLTYCGCVKNFNGKYTVSKRLAMFHYLSSVSCINSY